VVYDLGIDVGTSYTAAAIRRADGTIEVVGLGPIADNIPSVVYLNDDGSLIVGDAAARRAAIDPAGAAREFKRRLGDPTPLILRTSPFSAEALIAKMIDHVIGRLTERERERPRHTVVTHPANWGPYKLELFDQAFRIANVDDHSRLAEPQAAAMAYAVETRVPNGAVVAVYDLGGGTFDAAVLRKTDRGFEPLGESVGIEHLGGVDFDEAVLHHVRTQIGDRWPTDPNDPSLPAPMLRLRRACMEAKELLSTEHEVQIPVLLPGVDTTVNLQRPQFEAMITPRIEDTLTALDAAIASAGIGRDQLHAVLLVGGSSRIPLVSTKLQERFGSLVAGDIDPLYAVARGAALAAGAAVGETSGALFAGPGGPAGRPADQPGVPPRAAAPPTIVAGGPPRTPAAPAAPATPAAGGPAQPGPPPNPPANPAPRPAAAAPPPVLHGAAADDRLASAPPPRNPLAAAPPPRAGDVRAPASRGPAGPDRNVPPLTLNGEARKGGRIKILAPLVAVAVLAAAGGAYLLTRDSGQQGATDGTETTDQDGGPLNISTVASPVDMVPIPAGEYTLGSEKPGPNAAETLAKPYAVNAFHLDMFEVSNADYSRFVDEKGAAPALAWVGGRYAEGDEEKPVQGVSFDWATAYCTSLGKRLPTEMEWEAAARGTEARVYPWGNDAAAGGLPDIGVYEGGFVGTNVSPTGVFDMAGNVWEWVGDSYDPRVPKDSRVLRGGQNGYLRKNSERLPVAATSNALKIAGFRCAADQVDEAIAPLTFGDFVVPSVGNEVATTVPDPAVIIDDVFDDATSGWLERSSADMRFGYHPNGFFHLETKHEESSALVEGPVAVDPAQPVAIAVSAFVDPANTVADDGGIFAYGILFRSTLQQAEDRDALIFVVDPRSQNWAVCNFVPETGGWAVIDKKSRAIPENANLEVRATGPDTYEFLIGGQQVYSKTIPGYTGTGTGMALLSYKSSEKAHIHFDQFKIRKLS
jgi:formylglycine-generating enzyme required for sulfatase activity/actin-like ATPase involved in cell morphogenesis